MKNPIFLALATTIMAMTAIHAQQTIQFSNCEGTINAPGQWTIEPSHVSDCPPGNYNKITINRIAERTESGTTTMGPNCQGTHQWSFPNGYDGGSSVAAQYINPSKPGGYNYHNNADVALSITLNFLSDPHTKPDGKIGRASCRERV